MPAESDLKTDIFVALYIADYLADTSHLSTIEHGAYFLLLLHYYRKGPLPNDLARIAQITRLPHDAWSIAEGLLREFFALESDGLYHQKRADREIAEWRGKRMKAKEKAATAAKARWSNNAPSIPPSNTPSNTQAMHGSCPSPSPSPKKISDANASSPRRAAVGEKAQKSDERIYAAYPRKDGRREGLKAIHKAIARLKIGESPRTAMLPEEAVEFLLRKTVAYGSSPLVQTTDRQFIPHPATWFNQSRYLDDEAIWQEPRIESPRGSLGTESSPTHQRVSANKRALAEAVERRTGTVSPSIARVERAIGAWNRAFAKRDAARRIPSPPL